MHGGFGYGSICLPANLSDYLCMIAFPPLYVFIDQKRKKFKNIDELDFLNKRAILVYVRDISGLSPKQLSVAMSSIRKHYRRLVGPDLKYDLF